MIDESGGGVVGTAAACGACTAKAGGMRSQQCILQRHDRACCDLSTCGLLSSPAHESAMLPLEAARVLSITLAVAQGQHRDCHAVAHGPSFTVHRQPQATPARAALRCGLGGRVL